MNSMMWMRMPGQTWPGVAASFLAMWIVMMAAMMLPSLVPMLWRYGRAFGATSAALVGVGYFFVWTTLGAAVFPLGVALSGVAMRQPVLSGIVGVVVLIAGVFQFTPLKARRLASRTEISASSPDAFAAWRHGIHLGVHCAQCCAGLMAIPLVVGIMDLRVMAVVTAAITAERLAPSGIRVARTIGAVVIAAGMLLVARATGLSG